jgi:hypothetical protein
MNALALQVRRSESGTGGRPLTETEELTLLLGALRRLLHTSAASERELDLAVLAHATAEVGARWPDLAELAMLPRELRRSTADAVHPRGLPRC